MATFPVRLSGSGEGRCVTLLPPETKSNGGSTSDATTMGVSFGAAEISNLLAEPRGADSSQEQTRPNPPAADLTPLPPIAILRWAPSPCGRGPLGKENASGALDRPARAECLRDLGDVVHDLEQSLDVFVVGGRAHFYLVADPLRSPRLTIEITCCGDPDAIDPDSEPLRLPVNVVENTTGNRKMEEIATVEVALHDHATVGPPMLELDALMGPRPQVP